MYKNQEIRVVVAEDDFLVGKEIERALKAKGYNVVGRATTGVQAVEMVGTLRPDMVVMDIKMPEMDGIEAVKQIQERFPTPAVILTAHETPDFLDKASSAGAGAYLLKPPSAEELERGITIARARHQDLLRLHELLAAVEEKNAALEKALEEIKILRGIIPICMYCKKIRDDKGYWEQVEKYITEHSEVTFSHGICPDCYTKHFPDY